LGLFSDGRNYEETLTTINSDPDKTIEALKVHFLPRVLIDSRLYMVLHCRIIRNYGLSRLRFWLSISNLFHGVRDTLGLHFMLLPRSSLQPTSSSCV